MSSESRDCNENVKEIEIEEGGDSIEAIETENLQNNMTEVNRMVCIARQRGHRAIAKMLESAYRDDCNYSVTAVEELKEIKEKMPEFMHEHGFPIKALACTGETAPQELSDTRFINTDGYNWEPSTDKLKIMTPKLFLGDKKKGRFTKDTRFFEGEATLENITKFFEG